MEASRKLHLPRLAPGYYEGLAYIHWTFTLQDRATGWLTESFHHHWKILLLHACSRYDLIAPAYVLMPDHMHVLLLGLDEKGSPQGVAIEFLRKHLRRHLGSAAWQRQPYDNVLREHERSHGAVTTTARYILENAVRARLVRRWDDYPYLGFSIPGYPDLEIRSKDYWDLFWRIYTRLTGRSHKSTRSRSQLR